MILWHDNLQHSRTTLVLNLLGSGLLMLLITFVLRREATPLWGLPLWGICMLGLLFETIRNHQRILASRGVLALLADSTAYWQQSTYQITGQPLILKTGILLPLRTIQSGRLRRLWLASDSLSEEKWRALRQFLLQSASTADKIYR